MDAIRIKNLRSLGDTRFVQIKPITLLLGQNSSGKSTFLRSFPLVRQSVDSRTNGPILWYGQYVDLGSFQDSRSVFSDKKDIEFEYKFRVSSNSFYRRRSYIDDLPRRTPMPLMDITCSLSIVGGSKEEGSFHKKVEISFFDQIFSLDLDSTSPRFNKINSITVNKTIFSSEYLSGYLFSPRGFLPHIINSIEGPSYRQAFIQKLISEIKALVHGRTQEQSIIDLIRKIPLGSSEYMLQEMREVKNNSITTWVENVSSWTCETPVFQRIRDLLIASYFEEILSVADDYITSVYKNSKYIAPIRATAERYYRIQNLAVDEVDFQGQNLPMFLLNISEGEQKKFSEWTEKLFGFSVKPQPSSGHISLTLRESGSEKDFNLADKGFGFSQLLPIVTQLWSVAQNKPLIRTGRTKTPVIFTMEQPELHLHPSLQAKFMDACASIINNDSKMRDDGRGVRLVIETHSETMVNRLGHLISKGQLDPELVNVVIFEKEDVDKPSEVRFAEFDSDGYLKNWPSGFFLPEWD